VLSVEDSVLLGCGVASLGVIGYRRFEGTVPSSSTIENCGKNWEPSTASDATTF